MKAKGTAITSLEDLREHLQGPMALEHATLPEFVTANEQSRVFIFEDAG